VATERHWVALLQFAVGAARAGNTPHILNATAKITTMANNLCFTICLLEKV
jgi:hypothetical protein